MLLSATEYALGLPLRVVTYTDGSLTRLDSYYGNGRRKSSLGYKAGKSDGPAVSWRDDGTRTEQGEHKGGKKTGMWYQFAEDGTVSRVEKYAPGQRMKTGNKRATKTPEIPTAVLEVGVGICDHYLRRFLSCEGLPQEGRAALPDAWEQLAQRKHAAARQEVESTCRAAASQWDGQLSSLANRRR